MRAMLLASSALLCAPNIARADDIQSIGFLPGGVYTQGMAISADGQAVAGIGSSFAAAGWYEAFRWTSGGGMTGLGFLPGGTSSQGFGISADGSVVVGGSKSTNTAFSEPFRWESGVMASLGFLPGGDLGVAFAVNADGSVVAGMSNSGTTLDQAFRWTGGVMTGLGFLPGGTYSEARAINADGLVVAGNSENSAGQVEAFRWVFNGTGPNGGGIMTGLGFLPGGNLSTARSISADGSIIVGLARSAAVPLGVAYRWTAGTGMVALGTLAGGNFSDAAAISANGAVIVGASGSASAPYGYEAFRWSAASGMRSIYDLLVGKGVNMTGWNLTGANAVSGDGSIIVGGMCDPSAQCETWIARVSEPDALPGTGSDGIITMNTVAQSFSGQAAMGHTGNSAISGALGTMSEYATQAQGSKASRNTPYSVFASAGYDSDPIASSTLGATVDLPNALVGGLAVSANYVKTEMVYDGSANMTGGSFSAFVARMPDAGLQWLVGASVLMIRGDVERGYLNGSGQAYSRGDTSATGYGATARLGWMFNNVWRATQVTPFASYTVSTMHFEGYTETTGAFPAVFDGFNATAHTARLGVDARYTLAPGQWLWGTLAWAHRLDNGKSPDITGRLIGLFGLTVPGGSVETDWLEATAGLRLPMWKNGAVTASVTASVPAEGVTTFVTRVGLSQTF